MAAAGPQQDDDDFNMFTFDEDQHFSPEETRQQLLMSSRSEHNASKLTSTLPIKQNDPEIHERKTILVQQQPSGTLTHRFEVKVATSLRQEKENRNPQKKQTKPDTTTEDMVDEDTIGHEHEAGYSEDQ